MAVGDDFWMIMAQALHALAAVAALLCAAWLFSRRDRFGLARPPLIVALVLSAAWSGTLALGADRTLIGIAVETARASAWLFVLYRLFAMDGRHANLRQVRPLLMVLLAVALLVAPVQMLAASGLPDAVARLAAFRLSALLHLMEAVGGLVLVHNLYIGASGPARLVLRWPAVALGAMWVFDLNHYTVAYLSDADPGALGALRGLVAAGMAMPLAFGATQGSEALRFRPSRAVTFQSVSLLMIGGYLLGMFAVGQWVAFTRGDWAEPLQFGFVGIATLGAFALLFSRNLRGWLRVTIAKHLFQHRYDYREEWMRFTRTIGVGGGADVTLHERIIRALADIIDSPAGLLLVPGEQNDLVLAARWQWPTVDVPAEALGPTDVRFFESHGFIADLDHVRSGRSRHGENEHAPAWLVDDARAWAMVPLLHFERLAGMVILARPPLVRQLDWEDFDLLRIAGQQLASYLAEHVGQEALAEASRFDDFHRRIAFVMHDIKNLASQLSLLARNAEMHAGNPEFQADMLVTLRNSTDKLNALLARLSRYGGGPSDELQAVRADEVAQGVVAQFEGRHPVTLVGSVPCTVAARTEQLEQALLHIIQNAVDASPPDSPVFVRVAADKLHGVIEVLDTGEGMSPDFVRSRLFKPFVSSKQGGFGIGAYEARELIRAMHGRLDVESREGMGSRFVVRLPLAEASNLLKTMESKRVA